MRNQTNAGRKGVGGGGQGVILTDFLDGNGFDADHFRGELLLLPLLLLLHEREGDDLADRVLRLCKLKSHLSGKGGRQCGEQEKSHTLLVKNMTSRSTPRPHPLKSDVSSSPQCVVSKKMICIPGRRQTVLERIAVLVTETIDVIWKIGLNGLLLGMCRSSRR